MSNIKLCMAELKALKPGWLGGEGQAIRGETDWLTAKIEALPWYCWPAIYPTEDGRVRLEWSYDDSYPSIDIDLETKIGNWHCLGAECVLDLADPNVWVVLPLVISKRRELTTAYQNTDEISYPDDKHRKFTEHLASSLAQSIMQRPESRDDLEAFQVHWEPCRHDGSRHNWIVFAVLKGQLVGAKADVNRTDFTDSEAIVIARNAETIASARLAQTWTRLEGGEFEAYTTKATV